MPTTIKHLARHAALVLLLAEALAAQQSHDPQRRSLSGLRTVAVHARVQVAGRTLLGTVDQAGLQSRLARELRQEGIEVQEGGDVRDGSAGQISLLYLVLPIAAGEGRPAGFAASSCLHASQYVRIPRLEKGGRIVYTVAPTWSSCGVIVGDIGSYRSTVSRNAEEQIARFLRAWRSVNAPRPVEPVPPSQSADGRGIFVSPPRPSQVQLTESETRPR
jgi:hypothetical protein